MADTPTPSTPPVRLPHTLHLTIDKHGWISWSLDCPYSTTEVDRRPGRNCNLLVENTEPPPEPPFPGRSAYIGIDGGPSDCATGEPVPRREADAWREWLAAVDSREEWVATPGCFAIDSMDALGGEDIICLDVKDPSFPMAVDVEVDGYADGASVVIVPWVDPVAKP